MRFRITPNTSAFYELFSEAGANLRTAVVGLQDLVENFTDLETKHKAVTACERKGDELTRTILRNLDTTFVTPFDREDISALAEGLDNVVDGVYHLSEILVLMPISFILPELKEQVTIMARMAETLVKVVDGLETMSGIRPLIDQIDADESEGDRVFRRSLAKLFSGELEALDVIKWKDILEAAEGTIDELEDAADVVGTILVKHA